jgi:expansin (peptidoglycan-binding protein)
LNEAARRSFDNAHWGCAIGSKKIAVSVVKIAPLADSSWIKLNKKFFCFFFFKKRNAKEKELANKLHCNSGLAYPSIH